MVWVLGGCAWVLTIAEAVLSPSLFSTISVAFLLATLVVCMATPLNIYSSHATQSALPNIIWTVFAAYKLISVGIKLALYLTSVREGLSTDMQAFLQLESLLWVLLPLVAVPFIAGGIWIRPVTRPLRSYSERINPLGALPLYLALTSLVVLVQIFSVSVTGLAYLCLMVYLLAMHSFNFRDGYFRALLVMLQCSSAAVITASVLVTSPYLQNSTLLGTYRMVGINSINDFVTDAYSRGHIICQGLLALLTAYLNYLAIYQRANSAFLARFPPQAPLPEVPILPAAELTDQLLPRRRKARSASSEPKAAQV